MPPHLAPLPQLDIGLTSESSSWSELTAGPHLCQEVDLEASGLVGLGLSVVEIVAHGQHKLREEKQG